MEEREISYIAVAKKNWGCGYGYYGCDELDLNKTIRLRGMTLEEATKYLFEWCLKNTQYHISVDDFKIYHVIGKDLPCSNTLRLLRGYEEYKNTKNTIKQNKKDTVKRIESAKLELRYTISKIASFDKEIGTLKQLQGRYQQLLKDKEDFERQIPILEEEAREAAKKKYVHLTYEEYIQQHR